MRIVLWHGYLLGGTGSNVYTRALARTWSRLGHEVVVVCQERNPDAYDLGGESRDGEHTDDDVLVPDDVAEAPVVADDDVSDRGADLALVVVEDRRDRDPVLAEDRRAGDRLSEQAGADEGDVVLTLSAQDLADLAEKAVDRVADAALAELAEVRQVATDLRRVDVRVVRDLLRGDPLLAHLAGLGQHLEVAGEARGDSDRQPIRDHQCSFVFSAS